MDRKISLLILKLITGMDCLAGCRTGGTAVPTNIPSSAIARECFYSLVSKAREYREDPPGAGVVETRPRKQIPSQRLGLFLLHPLPEASPLRRGLEQLQGG